MQNWQRYREEEKGGPAMTHFEFPGMENFRKRLLQSPHVLLALDYDGTLTSIVDDPVEALLSSSTRHLLSELARRDDVDVAIVSGRALVDLQDMVAIPGVIYAGNHGMEISGPCLRFIEPSAQASAPVLHEMALDLGTNLRQVPGAFVEDKGLTLSIHYRKVVPGDVEEVWDTVLCAVEPMSDRFHITRGAKVFEVLPLVHWNKGAAVTWIEEQLGFPGALVVYVGDDATDEHAFSALDGNDVTIKVGDGTAATAARFLLPSPAEVHGLLRWVHELRQERPQP
jgi:trehalose 6-phosphate phosphatase